MTRTEELLKLAEAAEPYWYGPINGPVQDFVDEVTPPLLRQLVELCRLMAPLVEECCDCHAEYDNTKHKEAIAAFNKFERKNDAGT